MKRRIYWSMCLIATLILSFIAYEGALVLGTTPSGDNQTSSNAVWQEKILTPEEVEKMFPNLPSAAELMNRTPRAIVPSSIGVQNVTYFNVPDYLHGGIIPTHTSIWLKYNETIWIAVLDIENLTSAQSSASSSEPRINARTWALGIYANPGEIAGGQAVEGAISFGSWGTWSGALDMYIGADVLSIYDGVFVMQIVEEAISFSDNKYVAVEITGPGHDYRHWPLPPIPPGELHSIQIRYSLIFQGWWDFLFDNTWYYSLYDKQNQILTGNQPNVVFETNDYTEWGGLSGYQTWIGGPPTPSWSQPALAYFIRGRQIWYPYYPADTLPTAYAYYGGSWANNVIFRVGIDPPLIEWGEMGHDFWQGFQPDPERLYWGWLLPQPPEGTMMWHNG